MDRRQSSIRSLDWITILLFLFFIGFGWISIFASSLGDEPSMSINLDTRAGKQLLWIGASVVLALVVLLTDSKFFEAFAYPIYAAILLLLVAVLVVGVEVKGATSWIAIGSFRLQPAEFMKFATALALAKVLSRFNFSFNRIKDLALAFFITFFPSALILLQNDTGSALVYASLVLVMYRQGLSGIFLTAAILAVLYFIFSLIYSQSMVLVMILALAIIGILIQKKYRILLGIAIISATATGILLLLNVFGIYKPDLKMVLTVVIILSAAYLFFKALVDKSRVLALAGLFLIISIGYTLSTNYVFEKVLEDHQRTRIEVLLGIKSDPSGAGYNVKQSRIAIGSGGFTGKGFLNGTYTKFKYVPEQSTDFIFCTVGEEWGFLGTFTVIAMFSFFLIRLIYLAERQRSLFSKIYGYGVFSIFLFHFIINIGMTIGLAPVIGIPLPFFSYGGSSLWGFTILLFIFLKLDSNRMQILA
ncbi:rod shape-determining protein RodA [Saccharicrinis sp. FJH54]|uniref:rod shape-determining protein RodA n=1 Tax=Saccharicrinis sp. FJH54 TaxID=3344665 RepID=UPI0035D3FEBD